MKIQHAMTAALFSLLAATGAQAQVTVFEGAFLGPVPPGGGDVGGIVLYGFGRNTSVLNLQASEASGRGVPAQVPYFDTWNIGTASVAPGVYNFNALLVEAEGSATFSGITFNSYDAQGARSTILFNINAAGTAAVGSGSFTVLASCPVETCVWIDVIGLRPVGAPWGYGGTGTALPVPEPGQWALLGLGLAAVAGAVRRGRKAGAPATA
jgi:hypothetical protein